MIKGFIASIITVLVALNVPATWLNPFQEEKVGALTYTQLNGAESLSNFPTLWNATLASLDAEVFEKSDWFATTSATQLTGLGTITTGVWNGSTISGTYGGTGTTSPTSNLLLLGNGSSGLKVVNGSGTTGQFLVSNGVGVAPTWETGGVDGALDYTWTGHNVFSSLFATQASTTRATTTALTITGSKLRINGNEYEFSSAAGATLPYVLFASTTSRLATGSTASTTVATYAVQANEMGPNTHLRITGVCRFTGGSSDLNFCSIKFGTGSATTTLVAAGPVDVDTSIPATLSASIFNQNSQSSQFFLGQSLNYETGAEYYISGTDTKNTANQFYISFETKQTSAADTARFQGMTITKY